MIDSNSMWEQLLIVFGGNATLLIVLGFLFRSLISQLLTKDIEKFKTQLKADADKSVEQYKSTLQMTALEHQVRFSKLHEKRGEVLADVYERLVESERLAKQYVFHKKSDEAAYLAAVKSVREFHDFVELHRIYLPEKIGILLSDFAGALWNPVTGVWMNADVDASNPAAFTERKKEFMQAFEAFNDSGNVVKARRLIEDEFRQILEGSLGSIPTT